MDFTPAQQLAIDTRNCSLLVAAGAGSGKTRVLTERIIDRLLDENCSSDITEFLIVTFTNAAAKELTDRIRNALTTRSTEVADNKKIIRNLALLPQAKISTIHSFCYDLVKENFHKLGYPPKARIAEETETSVILSGIVNDIIEEKLSSKSENEYFLTVYELFTDGRKDSFLNTIVYLYNKLLNLPEPEAYLDICCNRFEESEKSDNFFDTYFGQFLHSIAVKTVEETIAGINKCLDKTKYDEEIYSKFKAKLDIDLAGLGNILSSLASSYDDAAYSFNVFKPQVIQAGKMKDHEFAKSVYASVKNYRSAVTDLAAKFFASSSNSLRICAADSLNIMLEIKDIFMRIHSRFGELKKSYGILTFSDVEHMTLKILYDDINKGIVSETAKEIAKDFKELYIDEYQDVNPLQDMIFSAISKKDADGNDVNRFLVGDSKQSIYGFRGARPSIFNSYRASFEDVLESQASGRRLFMQNNFRCSESVISFTNMLFDYVMPEEYSENDSLIYSKKEEFKVETPVKLLWCNCDGLERNIAQNRAPIQAQAVLDEINRVVENPDVLNSQGEMYKLSDVAILTQTWSPAIYLEKFLTESGIPVVCEKGESFFEKREIRLALCILESVDNPERDIPTAGFMRSVAGFDDNELAIIRRASKDGSLFTAVNRYGVSDKPDFRIAAKITRFLNLHSELRTLSRNCSVSDFIRKMYVKCDLVNICASDYFGSFAKEHASVSKKNLLRLYDMAREFDKTVFKGISAFTDYLSAKKIDDSVKSSVGSSDDGVKIMTVHSSKGLEFPICFVYSAEHGIQSDSERLVQNDEFGIAFNLNSMENVKSINGKFGYVTADTPFKNIIRLANSLNEYLESKRLFYVALTRARDLLYITAAPDKSEKLAELSEYSENIPEKGMNWLEWVLGFIAEKGKLHELTTKGECTISDENDKCVLSATVVNYTDSTDIDADVIETGENTFEMDEKQNFEVDFELLDKIKLDVKARIEAAHRTASVPPKLTVTQLKHGLIDYDETESASNAQRKVLEMPYFIKESSDKTAAEKGTAMHVFMQFADFDLCVKNGCIKEADRLLEEEFITERQHEMLDTDKLDGFFKTKLYNDIKSAKNVYRELRFNLKTRSDEVIAGIPENDDFVLVQGVIDCFMENNDGTYTVIDFKTDNVLLENGAEVLKERYRNQLAFYCRAVEDITKKKVSRSVIFSFALMDTVEM